MAEKDGVGSSGVVLAFVAGALVGAVAALLFAPASGEETREYLERQSKEGREKASEVARQAREALDRQREELATAFERARESHQANKESDV